MTEVKGWDKDRIRKALKTARDAGQAEAKATLTVDPRTAPRKAGKGLGRGTMNRPRMTRHTFQLRLTAGQPWAPDDQPGVQRCGNYRTWRGYSRIYQEQKACFLQSGKHTIEAPTWAIMAQRLGLV